MMSVSPEEVVPSAGEWPVDPQEDVPISEHRLWVDGCFDFSHHGEQLPFANALFPKLIWTEVFRPRGSYAPSSQIGQ